MISSVFKKALLTSAFLFLSPAVIADAADCSADRIDSGVTVSKVYDGDTVRLTNGDKLRIVGINTPELGRDGRPSQPFARKAQQRLQSLLRQNGNRIELKFGAERRDRYRRLLAHAYLTDDRNIGAILLREGLAVAVAVPPNTSGFRCYSHAESIARQHNRGVWSQDNGGVVAAHSLNHRARGFHVVDGTVSSINSGRKQSIITLDGRLQLRINKRDYPYFSSNYISGLHGKSIRVRGWISGGSDVLRMSLRHPASLEMN